MRCARRRDSSRGQSRRRERGRYRGVWPTLRVQRAALTAQGRVLLVDDWIETGGRRGRPSGSSSAAGIVRRRGGGVQRAEPDPVELRLLHALVRRDEPAGVGGTRNSALVPAVERPCGPPAAAPPALLRSAALRRIPPLATFRPTVRPDAGRRGLRSAGRPAFGEPGGLLWPGGVVVPKRAVGAVTMCHSGLPRCTGPAAAAQLGAQAPGASRWQGHEVPRRELELAGLQQLEAKLAADRVDGAFSTFGKACMERCSLSRLASWIALTGRCDGDAAALKLRPDHPADLRRPARRATPSSRSRPSRRRRRSPRRRPGTYGPRPRAVRLALTLARTSGLSGPPRCSVIRGSPINRSSSGTSPLAHGFEGHRRAPLGPQP